MNSKQLAVGIMILIVIAAGVVVPPYIRYLLTEIFIFAIFTLFLIVLSKSSEIHQVLIVSAVVIAAVRITDYYKDEELLKK